MISGYTANDEWFRTLAAILKLRKGVATRAFQTY